MAVIGASGRAGSMGQAPVRYLRDNGYGGDILPVNPRAEEVLGYRCYPSVADCPGPVDLALVMVGADHVPGVIEECAAKNVGFAVVLASGFAESGAEGERRQRELIGLAEAGGLRLIGPNCIGLVNPHFNLVAGFSPLFAKAEWRPGEIGLVSQSGALGYGIVSLALDRGLRFSRVLNTGNEAAFSSLEAVRDLLLDDVTRVVLVYSEGLQKADEWPALARLALQRDKPIVMLKVGRSEVGSRAAASHTAALAGDDEVLSAVCRQLGIVRVDDVDHLLDVAATLRQPRRPKGNRVGILTTSGGAGVMAADACADFGLEVAVLGDDTRAQLQEIVPWFGSVLNPVDVTAQVIADRELFRRCIGLMAADPGVDLLLCSVCVLTGDSALRVVEDVLQTAAETDKPVLFSKTGADSLAPEARPSLLAAGIPVFETSVQAVRAIAALVHFQRVRDGSGTGEHTAAAGEPPAGFPAPGESLSERVAKEILGQHGLPVTREGLAESAEAAVALAADIGYPVALKIESPDILHKTEVGGVTLDLHGPDDVATAYGDVVASVRALVPGARISGVLVQEQVSGGVEMLIGVVPSEFGPMITVGAGGVLVEVLRDTAMRLVPVDRQEAEAMVSELRSMALLRGVRGRGPADLDALVSLIVSVSELAASAAGEWELDLNPVVVLGAGEGARVVDALLTGRASP